MVVVVVGLSSATGVTTAAAPCGPYTRAAPLNHRYWPTNKLKPAGTCKKCHWFGPGQSLVKEGRLDLVVRRHKEAEREYGQVEKGDDHGRPSWM